MSVAFREVTGRTWTLIEILPSGLYAACERDDGTRDVLAIIDRQLFHDGFPLTPVRKADLSMAIGMVIERIQEERKEREEASTK